MRAPLLLIAAIGLFAEGAFADENPFLKPEIRKPAPSPVIASPSTDPAAMPTDPSMMGMGNGGIINAKLIAVINGEEVWLTDDDKTYVRQKERDNSHLQLREAAPDMAAGAPELPVVSAGRPSPENTPR